MLLLLRLQVWSLSQSQGLYQRNEHPGVTRLRSRVGLEARAYMPGVRYIRHRIPTATTPTKPRTSTVAPRGEDASFNTATQVESWQEQYPPPQSIVPGSQIFVQAISAQLSGVLTCVQLDAWQQDDFLQSTSALQLCARH